MVKKEYFDEFQLVVQYEWCQKSDMRYYHGIYSWCKKKTRSLKLVIMQKKSEYNNIFTRGFISYSKWLKNCLVILMEILIYILNVC